MKQIYHAANLAKPTFHGIRAKRNSQDGQPKQYRDSWTDFTLEDQIPISNPWLSRYHESAILHTNVGPDLISTTNKELYGNKTDPVVFRIGNGGAGYTHVLKTLCSEFIKSHGNDFRIGWVSNHSRHTQAALLGDIVQVALTYEPDTEELAVQEGWCRRICAPAFWDHFILVGPKANPAGLEPGSTVTQALKLIVTKKALFHSRGDGSATFTREQTLWKEAGLEIASAGRLQTHALPPYQALQKAAADGAYLLTDRSTFLTVKQDGVIPNLAVYSEGGAELLNPCSALINTKVPRSPNQNLAMAFAEWLGEPTAQSLLAEYGRDWERGLSLFTSANQQEFGDEEKLTGQDL